MAFPPQFLDELRARLSVSELVGRKVRLVRKGREHSGLCPFHNEKTPSFTVNDEKGFFHCFGCGAHGDVIGFAMETEVLSFPEAIERLAGEAGLEVPRATPEERAREVRRATLYDVVEHACAWFEAQLRSPEGRAGYDYLRHRGFSDAVIARHRLGYAPDGRGRLTAALKAQGIERGQLVEAGLIKLPEGANGVRGEPRDYFFNRVIFPIGDRRGRIIAFGGRILGDGQPKYLNSPDTPLFHKGRVLYGWADAREAARDAGTVIVTEGYTDVIALARAGFGHSVAPLGTALTEEQIVELWRMADEPVLCFDGDNAGQRAAFRAANRALPLLKPGKSLRFVVLPAGEDPDSLIAGQGPGAMAALLDRARPLVDIIWDMERAQGRIDTPEQRAALEGRLNARVAEIAERGVQFQYQQEFRGRLRELLQPRRHKTGRQWDPRKSGNRSKFGDYGSREEQTRAVGILPPGDLGALRRQQNFMLLALLINHPALIDGVVEALGDISLNSEPLDRMLREILNQTVNSPELDSPALQRHLHETGFADQLGMVLHPRVYRQASGAAPEAQPDEAANLLQDIIARNRSSRLEPDRVAAVQDLGGDMTEEKSNRLLGIVREQNNSGGL
jgi:DNA primase